MEIALSVLGVHGGRRVGLEVRGDITLQACTGKPFLSNNAHALGSSIGPLLV
jgi:hypothetical protein